MLLHFLVFIQRRRTLRGDLAMGMPTLGKGLCSGGGGALGKYTGLRGTYKMGV